MIRFVLAALLAASASAHELTVRMETAQPAVIVRSSYAGDSPVDDADFRVFSPGDSENPFQTGLTDRSGAFAFVPSEPGEWRVVIDDGFGHRVEETLDVDWQRPTEPLGSESGLLQRAVMGVSIIFGITGIALWFQARRRAAS